MTQLELNVVRRGAAGGRIWVALMLPEEVHIADTVYDWETGKFRRLSFAYRPVKRSELQDGDVFIYREQACRIEGKHALPLADSERPYGPLVDVGAMPIDDDEMVQVLRKYPVSTVEKLEH